MTDNRAAQPSFSIVMPTFERKALVCEAVAALGRIAYDGVVEVIVVVDGSRDGTAQALRDIALDRPLRIVEQANSGAARARNAGAALARGDILLFLDDDMFAQPDLLRRHAARYRAGADAVLGHMPLDPRSPPGFMSEGVAAWAAARLERLQATDTLELHDLLTGQLSVRRSVFEELGGFDEDFTAHGGFGNEDLEFGARLLEKHTVVFAPEAVSHQRYVVTPGQLLRQSRDAGRADALLARKRPDLARQLSDAASPDRRGIRSLAQALAQVPGAPRALSRVAELVMTGGSAPRWAQRLFLVARRTEYWAGVREAKSPRRQTATVLCYHAIADLSEDPVLAQYGVPRADFERQLDGLVATGHRFVSPADFRAYLKRTRRLPPRAILLTFDDCYPELLDVARELLRPRGIPALAFAVSDLASNAWDEAIGARKMPLLDAAGLAALAQAGVEIGAHSRTHRSLKGLSAHELRDETRGAADQLARMGLSRPAFFAFPYGEHDAAARAAVEDAGYAAGFALTRAPVSEKSPRFALPRIEVLARDMGRRFRLKARWPLFARLLP